MSAVTLNAAKVAGTEPSPILTFLLMVALYAPLVVTVLQTFKIMPFVNSTWKARRALILERYSTINTGGPDPAAIVPPGDDKPDDARTHLDAYEAMLKDMGPDEEHEEGLLEHAKVLRDKL